MDRPTPRHKIEIGISVNSKEEFVTLLQDMINTIDCEKGEDYLDNVQLTTGRYYVSAISFNEDMTKEKYVRELMEYLEDRNK